MADESWGACWSILLEILQDWKLHRYAPVCVSSTLVYIPLLITQEPLEFKVSAVNICIVAADMSIHSRLLLENRCYPNSRISDSLQIV